MSGDDPDDLDGHDDAHVPEALHDRVTELFVQYRGYEPATFQESLSLVADLAARQIDAEADGAATDDSVDEDGAGDGTVGTTTDGTATATGDETAPATDDGRSTASAADPTPSESVTNLSAEVVDDVAENEFEPVGGTLDGEASAGPGSGTLDRSASTDGSGDVATGASDDSALLDDGATGDRDSSLDDGGVSADDVPESIRANPESNCALCGDVHRVSVLQTTILDGTGSVALICPTCAD